MAIARTSTWATTVDKAQLEGYGIPSDGLGNLGDRYYDLTNRIWYVKRYVGNLNGADNIYLPQFRTITPVCSIETTFRTRDSFLTDGNSDIFGNELVMKVRSSLGFIVILIGNSAGNAWTVMGDTCTPILNAGTWYKFRVDVDMPNGTVKTYVNDELTYTKTGQSINTSKSGFRFGNTDMIPAGTLMANCKYNGIFLPVSEGTGTAISDTFGRAYGTLSDSSPTDFWKVTWMAIDLSYPVV